MFEMGHLDWKKISSCNAEKYLTSSSVKGSNVFEGETLNSY